MQRLLAWDTSSKTGSVVALEWEGAAGPRVVSEWTLSVSAAHSEKLLWAIDRVFESAGWKAEDVDCFGVGVGPGSFTGLRIGLTTARTLAHSLGKPLVGVSSLAALARPSADWLTASGARAIIVAATDAAKGEVFALWGAARSVVDCVSRSNGDLPGLWKRGVEETVLRPEDLLKAVKRKLREGRPAPAWMVVGEGAERYSELWRQLPARSRLMPPRMSSEHVQARAVGILAWEALQAGLGQDPLSIKPAYLRVADAERKLKAGLLPVSPDWSQGDAEEPLAIVRSRRSGNA